MRYLQPSFDENSMPTYLHIARERCARRKEESREAQIECNPRAGEDLLRSFRQSPRLYPPVHAAKPRERPSLLLPPQGARNGRSIAIDREDDRRPHGWKAHYWSLRHQPSEPTVQVGRH